MSDRSFLENKGQFDGRTGIAGEKVLFGVDEGALQILFTAQGVTYRFDQKEKNYYRQRGDRTKPRMNNRSDLVHMRWEGGSRNVQVVPDGLKQNHHTYSSLLPDKSTHDITGVRGHERITYKGLYPGVDVVYTIHPEKGLKYELVVAPGADLTMVNMRYTADRALILEEDGNLRIATPFGDIVDHAPHSHYKGRTDEAIPSRFVLNGNTVAFALDAYDKRRGIVVDPWVVTPAFPNSNKIWDVEVDAASNVYIYGGDTPLRLRKYDPLGNLLWTYNTPWDTANYWIGSMVTDPAGNSFITAGTDPRIARINTNGTLVWSANGGLFDEYWRMSFNCDHTQMVLGGTRLVIGPTLFPVGYGRAFRMDLNNGSVINSVNVASLSPSLIIDNPNEIRALSASPNGRYYFMTLDTIGCITENLNLIYRRNNSYAFSYQVAGFGVTNQAINAIAATQNELYTQNGTTLHKRDLNTGVILATATIPGGNASSTLGLNSPQNSGLSLDSCGNVLVGSGNGVHLFDPNLNLLASATTPGPVYDVAINHNGEVVACGQGFLTSIALGGCAPPVVECCYSSIDPIGSICVEDEPFDLSAGTSGGTWSGPGIIDASSGSFDPGVAGVGTHTITYTLACGYSTIDVVVGPCQDLFVCIDPDNGTLNASNGVGPYVWEQQITVQDCSACFLGCFIPPGCAVNVLAWGPLGVGSSIPAPSSYPIQVTDAAGTVILINSAAELSDCTPCPSIDLVVSDVVDALCNGASTGTATVVASGGTDPYTYTWAPGGMSGSVQTALTAGTYQVTVTDSVGCSDVTTVTITEPPAMVIVVDPVTDVTCAGDDGAATVSVSGGTPNYTIAWSNGDVGPSVTGVGQGMYTVLVTDALGCTDSIAVTINSTDGPVIIDIIPTASACAPPSGTITVNATGTGLEYSIDGTTFQASNAFTGVAGGTYTIIVRDGEGCITSATVTVGSPVLPAPVITGNSVACVGDTLMLSIPDGFASQEWSTGETTSTIAVTGTSSITVTVTDAQGCVGTSAPFDVVFGAPQASFTTDPISPQLPGATVDLEDTSIAPDGTIVQWWWDLGAPDSEATDPDVSWTYDEPGAYPIVLVVTDSNGCVDTVSVIYVILPEDITIPNVFSPNNDGHNDMFTIENITFFSNELAIFNRWGNMIYQVKDYRNQWNASGYPDGTYFYVLLLEDGREFTGHVTVLR